MPGTLKRIAGPQYLPSTAADVYTPPASTIYTVIKHIHVANKTGAAATFSLYISPTTGGTTGGTEIVSQKTVPANDYVDLFWAGLKMESSDFLVGVASAATTLTITVTGEQFVV
jgi:hypothetical protein